MSNTDKKVLWVSLVHVQFRDGSYLLVLIYRHRAEILVISIGYFIAQADLINVSCGKTVDYCMSRNRIIRRTDLPA